MTIICALYDSSQDQFWLGSNSGSLIGDTILPEHKSKWVRLADWALATTGRGPIPEIFVAERAKFPNQSDDVNQVLHFMRDALEKYQIGEKDDGFQDFGFSGLLVHRTGQYFEFDSKLAITAIPQDILWARGSGMDFALGADHAAKLGNFPPEKRVEFALDAAVALDSACPGEAIVERF